MLDAISRTRGALQAAQQLSIRAQRAVGNYRLAFTALALLAGAMAFDLLWPAESALRCVMTVGWVAWIFYMALAIRRRARVRAAALRLEQAARLLEDRHPELENALINAVQFSEQVSQEPDTPEAALMRSEMARAEREAGRLPVEEAADTAAVNTAKRRLTWLVLAVALTIFLFPRAWRFELPRFVLFWADYPPFTLTDFHVMPRGARVRPGESVTVTVRVGGQLPDTLALVTGSGSERGVSTPLVSSEADVYTQTLDNLTRDTWYYVRANTGRSERYLVRVERAPEVKSIALTLHPPAYTRRSAESKPLGDEGITGLFGTTIDLDVKATRDVESGKLLLTYPNAPGETVDLKPLSGKRSHAGGSFTLRRSGAFRIDLSGAGGLDTRDAAHGKVTLQRDEKPVVYIEQPGQNAMITPQMAVNVKAVAEDDISVQRVEIHRIVNNMADSVQTITVPPGQKRAEALAKLDFKDLGARPGDVIQYYATAYDANPGRPNLTDSERYWLWVVSEKDYRKALADQRGLPEMAQQYRALAQQLQELALQQRALANEMAKLRDEAGKRPGDAGRQQQMKALQDRQRQLRQRADDLARQMRSQSAQKPQYDVEKALQRKLAEMARQVGQASGAMQKAQSVSTPGAMTPQGEQAARQLARANGMSRQSIEKTLQALEKLAPLYQDVSRLQELAKQQKDLAVQARELAQQPKQNTFTRSRMQELARQQAAMRDGLRKVQQDLRDHASECSGLFPRAGKQAQQLAKALDGMRVGEMMQGAESAFKENDSPAGAGQAERASRALDSLVQQAGQCKNGTQQALDDQLAMSFGQGQGSGSTLPQMSRPLSLGGGEGQGQGNGTAYGSGGQSSPTPGSQPGNGTRSAGAAQRVTALTPQQAQGSSNRRESRTHPPAGEVASSPSEQEIERLPGAVRKPPQASDPSATRYPAEYRRLVKDYFKAVAGGR